MLQIYPFHGADVQEVYEKLNSFLYELAVLAIPVAPENVRSNTKTYPDYGTTATTIEVALYLNDKSDVAREIHDLHQSVVYRAKPATEKDAVASDFDPFLDGSE